MLALIFCGRCTLKPGEIAADFAVFDFNDPIRLFSDSSIMSDDDKSRFEFFIDVPEQFVNDFSGFGIQVAGGLIG